MATSRDHLHHGCTTKSTMGSTEGWAFGLEPWTPPALEDLLPELSRDEQLRLQGYLQEHERKLKLRKKISLAPSSQISEHKRDIYIICHTHYALHHYNTKHPGEEFDVVKPLMGASVRFKGQMWYHVNFLARCRKSKKIKRFFAEVHYKPPRPGSGCVYSCLPFSVPGAEKPPCRNSVCSNLPFPVPEAEKTSSSSSVCSNLPFPVQVPIVEACTIIEEPLGKYWRSCAFCRGHLDILHPKGRKFVCGNDKDRILQRLLPGWSISPEMPFTCPIGPASPNNRE